MQLTVNPIGCNASINNLYLGPCCLVSKEQRTNPYSGNYLFLKMKEIAQEKGYFIDTINDLDDHLHLLIKMNSYHSIGKIIKDLKGASSRWINEHQMVPGGFQWQRGYGAFSVSPWMVPSVKKYILDQ